MLRRVSIVFGVGGVFVTPAYFAEFVLDLYGVPMCWIVSDFACLLAGLFIATHWNVVREEQVTYIGDVPTKETLANQARSTVDLAETPRVDIPTIQVLSKIRTNP